MYRVLLLGPMLPVAMTAMNIYVFGQALLYQGRFKPNAFRYIFAYGVTIYPAIRGDMSPFLQILATPST